MFFGKFKPTAKVSELWEFIVTNPELIGNIFFLRGSVVPVGSKDTRVCHTI